MEYVDALLGQERYRALLEEIGRREQDRVYCRHDADHLLHVARIACILSLEHGDVLPREDIYLCALLHDIGRGTSEDGISGHAGQSAAIAEELLNAIGYPQSRIGPIVAAIRGHGRRKDGAAKIYSDGPAACRNLSELLQVADQLSRNCFLCPASDTCHWVDGEKNQTVVI